MHATTEESMFHTILRQMCVDTRDNGGNLDLRCFEMMLKDLVLLYSLSHPTHLSITVPKNIHNY